MFACVRCRLLAQERADFIKTTRYNREVIMSNYRQMKLQDYVTQVRTELHEGRAREKLEMMEEEIARYLKGMIDDVAAVYATYVVTL